MLPSRAGCAQHHRSTVFGTKKNVLDLAQGLEVAVIVREAIEGQVEKLGTLDRAQVMAKTMQDWLKCEDPQARIMRFHLTQSGLKLLAIVE